MDKVQTLVDTLVSPVVMLLLSTQTQFPLQHASLNVLMSIDVTCCALRARVACRTWAHAHTAQLEVWRGAVRIVSQPLAAKVAGDAQWAGQSAASLGSGLRPQAKCDELRVNRGGCCLPTLVEDTVNAALKLKLVSASRKRGGQPCQEPDDIRGRQHAASRVRWRQVLDN